MILLTYHNKNLKSILFLAIIVLAVVLAQSIYAAVATSGTNVNNSGTPTIDVVYVNDETFTLGITPEIILFPIDGSNTTLKVDFTYVAGDDYATIEFWSLKDDELTQVSDPDFKKDNREYQFLIKQPYAGEEIILIPGLTDKISPATEQYLTNAKPGDANYGVGGALEHKKLTWRSIPPTLEAFYDFTSKITERKYYLLIETNQRGADGKFLTPWNDSVPRLINLQKTEGEELNDAETWDIFDSQDEPIISADKCKTIPECKAILDLSFLQQVFKKKS